MTRNDEPEDKEFVTEWGARVASWGFIIPIVGFLGACAYVLIAR